MHKILKSLSPDKKGEKQKSLVYIPYVKIAKFNEFIAQNAILSRNERILSFFF